MRPDCSITEDDVNALVDDELCGREQRRVAAHVSGCPHCSALAGVTLAGKRLLGARSQPVDPPAHSWEHALAALDEVDGVARATRPTRSSRMLHTAPALAACGILLIVGALTWRSRTTEGVGDGPAFVRHHLAAASMVIPGGGSSVQEVVTPRPGGAAWIPVARWLFPLNGEFVDHTLYRVDRTRISEFIVSSHVFDSTGLRRAVLRGGGVYRVRSEPGGSVVAWESSGLTHVLVGRTGVTDLLSLAASRRSRGPLMRSM